MRLEKLGELLSENPGGLLLVRDELFGLLSRLSNEEFSGERAFYLEAYNGDGSYTYDRIGRGTIHIPSCTLSIVGGIQPLRVAPLVNEAVTGGGGDGLLQRFQLVSGPTKTRSGPELMTILVDRLVNSTSKSPVIFISWEARAQLR